MVCGYALTLTAVVGLEPVSWCMDRPFLTLTAVVGLEHVALCMNRSLL